MLEFVEAPSFQKSVYDYLDDDEYAALQWALVLNPDAGVLIPKSGGVRKLRWKAKGRGKSGGYRIIYFWHCQNSEIWLLTIFAKSEETNIPAHILRKLKEELENA